MRTTVRDITNKVARLNRITFGHEDGPYYAERNAQGWTLYKDLHPGAHDVFRHTATAGELWDLIGAFEDGWRARDAIEATS